MGVTFAGPDGKESEESEKLTEKEILLKILEKMTSMDQHLAEMLRMQSKDFARKTVARSNSGYRDTAFY
jgi:hypothetical protein